MAERDAVRALEALTPWDRPWFRQGLAALSASVADAARTFAQDAWTLSQLAGAVPRCPRDETGASPWTSFRQEVAVARGVSGQAAAAEIRTAMRLTSVLPHTLHLLEAGRLSGAAGEGVRQRARGRSTTSSPASSTATSPTGSRSSRRGGSRTRSGVPRWRWTRTPPRSAPPRRPPTGTCVFTPAPDGQACVTITGPAVPLTRWYTTLDTRARALRQAGDPRNLAALRFDLATSTFPCLTHPPADPSRTRSQPQAQAPALFGEADDIQPAQSAASGGRLRRRPAPRPAPRAAARRGASRRAAVVRRVWRRRRATAG